MCHFQSLSFIFRFLIVDALPAPHQSHRQRPRRFQLSAGTRDTKQDILQDHLDNFVCRLHRILTGDHFDLHWVAQPIMIGDTGASPPTIEFPMPLVITVRFPTDVEDDAHITFNHLCAPAGLSRLQCQINEGFVFAGNRSSDHYTAGHRGFP